jgi:hypothetical protein
MSQEAIDFFTSDAAYEQMIKDTEHLCLTYFNQQKKIAAGLNNGSPFNENTATQWMVFSKYLFDNGFYDGMKLDEVREKEDLLKKITGGMDTVGIMRYGSAYYGFLGDYYYLGSFELTSDEAYMELASSTSALKMFADKYLEGDMRERFHELADQYNKHNSEALSGYSSRWREERAKNIKYGHDLRGGTIHPQALPDTKYLLMRGGIAHTEEEKVKFHLTISEIFEKFRLGGENDDSFWNGLKEAFVGHATQNSHDSNFKSYMYDQAEKAFQRMDDYWSRLLTDNA